MHVCVSSVCAYVYAPLLMCTGARGYHSLPYFSEEVSLPEPGAASLFCFLSQIGL